MFAVAMTAISATAQQTSTKLVVTMKNGATTEYNLDEVDNLSFKLPETPKPSDEVAYRFMVPDDFGACRVQKVMADGKQVAEVDYEYIKSLTANHVVVYPMNGEGRADLTKGISAENGGSVVWNLTANTAEVTAGGGAVSTFYIVDGALTANEPSDVEIVDATVSPDYLVDTRGSESITYPIIKVGTQYWMAENLRATKYVSGKDIETFKTTDKSGWDGNTTGCYHMFADDSQSVEVYGLYYNGYAVLSDEGLAPEGWEVPTKAQATKLRTAGGPAAKNFKSDNATWWNGKQGDNMTGFNADPCGYYSTATGDNGDGIDFYGWTSTVYSDWLTKAQGLETIRLNANSANMAISNEAGHDKKFGHSVRCVRK